MSNRLIPDVGGGRETPGGAEGGRGRLDQDHDCSRGAGPAPPARELSCGTLLCSL